jgi:4-aminobutyrate aminotransferase
LTLTCVSLGIDGRMLPDSTRKAELDHLRSEGDLNLSTGRKSWIKEHLDLATQEILARDAACFLHQSLSTPCLNVLKSSSGSTMTDWQGREILDFHGNCVHQVGFGHPRVIEAITRQMQALSFCPRRYTCLPAIELAERLVSLAPTGLTRVLLAPGGTSAVGMALKIARAATGRFKTISMWESFHGASLDCISIGGEAIFRDRMGPLLPGANHVPPPDPGRCPFKCGASCNLTCAGYIEYVLEKERDVAAVIAETVRCTPLVPPPEYWRRIREACTRHGALLILDEIAIGLGRSGRMFACEHYGVTPDILVLGKGLGGGVFPLAAVMVREDLNATLPGGALGHYTHEKNPVACAAALAALQVIEDEKLLERARELGQEALNRLRTMASRHSLRVDVRGLGLLLGLELWRARGEEIEPATEEAEQMLHAALRRGLSFKVTMGNILTLTPPLTLSREELDRAIRILDESLSEAENVKQAGA